MVRPVHAPLIALSLFAAPAGALAAENCEVLEGCAWKMCTVRQDIAQAEIHNKKSVPGLKKQLENLTSYCEDTKMRVKLLDEIEDTRQKVAELQEEKTKEAADGKNAKAERLELEINAERQVIRKLEGELSHYK